MTDIKKPPEAVSSGGTPGGGFPRKPLARFKQRTNSPSIFQLSMITIDISYFPWYS